MTRKIVLVFLLAVFLFGGQALAESLDIEPGLWEHTMRMTSQSGQMEEMMREARRQLDALPPEQRQMMEQMMAAQGMSLGADESSFRICLTEEDIARDALHLADEHCTQEVLERSGDTIHVRFTCDDSRGEGKVTIVSRREYNGSAVIHTDIEGRAEVINIDQRARWLSSDCGNIQPSGR